MKKQTREEIKKTGSTFTPQLLADFLAERLLPYLHHSKVTVLDPACGDGELLISIGKKLTALDKIFKLFGYDENAVYLDIADTRLKELKAEDFRLINEDFLNEAPIDQTSDMDHATSKKNAEICEQYDIVIANPPYVRTQHLGSKKAQVLAKQYNLKGRVDLYYPFLIQMTARLKAGGLLGVITSNRYLTTKSGGSIRKFLSENFEILDLIDLGDTKLFNAAVLPAILIAKKGKSRNSMKGKFTKIYEEVEGDNETVTESESVFEIIKKSKAGYFSVGSRTYKQSVGRLMYNVSSTGIWELYSTTELDWIKKISAASKFRLEDLFKVKVGIKTTADNVFIADNWDSRKVKPEDELLKDLISQENIQPWAAEENASLRVLYPHYSENGQKYTIDLERYPNAKKYFQLHEDRLKSRRYLIEAGRKWFEIWVPHNPDHWKLPKLVFPDISASPRFYFDKQGKIVNGNCYWIAAHSPEDVDKLLLVQGIANSKLMTRYHDLVFNNRLYSGRRRYLTQYVEKYPLPDYQAEVSREIVTIVKLLNANGQTVLKKELEHELEKKVAEAFDVLPILT